jgi:hypothetical protein
MLSIHPLRSTHAEADGLARPMEYSKTGIAAKHTIQITHMNETERARRGLGNMRKKYYGSKEAWAQRAAANTKDVM